MSTPDLFKEIKTHLGTLDDLNQERRRIYTDWATQKLSADEFMARMAENLSSTERASAAFRRILPGQMS
ncbi:MAG TPA: hypothetical protein VFG76_04035 [Candidatus Polarisedimenticolia bacterium]|nr:hypothetical protein [Candidatus Polarisedimenticolia bacterium]